MDAGYRSEVRGDFSQAAYAKEHPKALPFMPALTSPPPSLAAASVKQRVVIRRRVAFAIDDSRGELASRERRIHLDSDRLGLASSLRTISKGRASFERDASGKRSLVVKGVLGWLSVLLAAGSIVVGSLVIAGFLLMMLFAQNKVMFVGAATTLLFMVLPPLIWSRTPWGRRYSEGNALTYLFARLAASRCGACDYDMQGSAVEEDGCTACAECGARWNLAGWKASLPAQPTRRPISLRDEAREFALVLLGRSRVLRNLSYRERSKRLRGLETKCLLRELRRLRLIDTLGILGVVVVMTVLAWQDNKSKGLVPFDTSDAITIAALALALKLVVSVSRAMHDAHAELRRSLTAQGVCSACESQLTHRACHADGMIVCEGCGARFALGEVGEGVK